MVARKKEKAIVLHKVVNIRINNVLSDKLEAHCKANKTTKTILLRKYIESL